MATSNPIGSLFSAVGSAIAPNLQTSVQDATDSISLGFEIMIGELAIIILLMFVILFTPRK